MDHNCSVTAPLFLVLQFLALHHTARRQFNLLLAHSTARTRQRKEKYDNKDHQNDLHRILSPPVPRDHRLLLMQILRRIIRHARHFILRSISGRFLGSFPRPNSTLTTFRQANHPPLESIRPLITPRSNLRYLPAFAWKYLHVSLSLKTSNPRILSWHD